MMTPQIFVIHDDVLEVGCCKQKGKPFLSVQEMDEAIQKAVEDEDSKTLEKRINHE